MEGSAAKDGRRGVAPAPATGSVLVWALCLAAGLFLRGLWFPAERYALFLPLLLAGGLLWKDLAGRQRDGAADRGRATPAPAGPAPELGWPGLALLLLTILYGLAVGWAVDRHAALDALLDHIAYLSAFVAALLAGRVARLSRLAFGAAAGAVGAVALFSLGAAFGLYAFPGAMFGARAAGPLQHANALGLLMASGCVLVAPAATRPGYGRRPTAGEPSPGAGRAARLLSGLVSGLAAVTLFLTASRAALVAWGAGLALLGAVSAARREWPALGRLAWLAAASSAGGAGASGALTGGNLGLAAAAAVLAVSAGLALAWGGRRAFRRYAVGAGDRFAWLGRDRRGRRG